MNKTTSDLIREGELMATMRKEMKIKQSEMAKYLNVQQGNLSHMEKGRQNSGNRFEEVRKLFYTWSVEEIKKLHGRIDYLEQLNKDDEDKLVCKCEKTIHKTDKDCFPYGDTCEYDQCVTCGKTFNYNTY